MVFVEMFVLKGQQVCGTRPAEEGKKPKLLCYQRSLIKVWRIIVWRVKYGEQLSIDKSSHWLLFLHSRSLYYEKDIMDGFSKHSLANWFRFPTF